VSNDPYAALGVSKGASEDAIKKAYRKLAKELHPDRNKDNPKATERFKTVSAAYALLNDTETRARYDRGEIDGDGNPRGFDPRTQGRSGGFQQGPGGMRFETGDLGDIFSDLFNFGGRAGRGGQAGGQTGGQQGGFGFEDFGGGPGPRAQAPRGQSVEYRVTIPFEDAALAKPQRLTLRNGKTIDVKIPAGFADGQQIRLSGQGSPGPGGMGDALITLKTGTHAKFSREGDDIRMDLSVSLKDAVLGAKVKAATVDGSVMVSVPAGSSSGKTLRLRGKGFTKKDGTRGDQLVVLMIEIPENDAALKAFAENWTAKV
jgi:DnaJ-class molecular chaperone